MSEDEITAGLVVPKLPNPLGHRVPVLLMVGGPAMTLGRAWRVIDELLIGRAGEADLWLDEEGVSRKHAKIFAQGSTIQVSDLGSRNGTWVNGTRITHATLKESDLIQIGASYILRFVYQDQLDEAAHRTLVDNATRDSLTGAYNRGSFLDLLRKDVSSAIRHRHHLSVAALDLDHFKLINDKYGHSTGDQVLRHFARTVSTLIRSEDTFGRIGGEEFALILRQCPEVDAAKKLEHIRQTVERLDVMAPGDQRVVVTVSIGVCGLEAGLVIADTELLEAADRALYEAKTAGRNRVAVQHH